MNSNGNKRFEGLRALVADDSEASREILGRILERAGIMVIAVADGAEAVALIQSETHQFDVILLDLVMENMGGIEAMAAIRRILGDRRCAITAVSATSTPELQAACLAAGAVGTIILKPFRAADVMAGVQLALDNAYTRPAPAISVPESKPSRVPQQSKMAPKMDLSAALERCGGDRQMLRDMLSRFGEQSLFHIERVREMLSANKLTMVLAALHNLRGDALNLGLLHPAQRLTELQRSVRNLKIQEWDEPGKRAGPQPAQLLEMRSALDEQLQHCGRDMAQHAVLIAQLPELEIDPDKVRHRVPAEEPSPSLMQSLLRALSRADPFARNLIPAGSRLLPPSYPHDVELLFRQHVESLEYAAALSLLQADDVPVATDEEPQSGYRLLVVATSALEVGMLCQMIKGLGVLRFALSGSEALVQMREWTPDVVIADAVLGEMTGNGLCQRMKADPQTAGAALILMADNNDLASEVESLMAGVADFIGRPLNTARVVGRISAQLENVSRLASAGGLSSSVLRAAATGFLTCTPGGNIIEVNPTLQHLLQIPAAELQGCALRELVDDESVAALEAALKASMDAGWPAPVNAMMPVRNYNSLPVRLTGWVVSGETGRFLWIAVQESDPILCAA